MAEGVVLEVGIGSGHNLPLYDPRKVERVIGLDPSCEMLAYAHARAEGCQFPVEWLALEGESIPMDRHSVDTVVVTYTLCTIPDAAKALLRMRDVLKPQGRLLFCEHGKAPDASVQRWQHWLNPIWKRIGGGCNLDRDIPRLLDTAGFDVASLETMYLPGTPRFTAFNYWGWARAT